MKILIVGGCGFLGSNLASYGIKKGYDITVFDNLSRVGSFDNLSWLKSLGNVTFVHGDTRCKDDVDNVIKDGKFDAVFHLAGQVAMTTSIANPYKDFQINTMGTLHVLDAIRRFSPNTIMTFSSTNKVYGDLEQYKYRETATRYVCDEWPNGFDESVPLDFHSPYGCSKGAADQYMLDFARIYHLKTIVFRHSSMYGGRQFATYDQGWVGWFCQKAIEKQKNKNCEKFTISGNGKQVRDILHADDMINLYYMSIANADKMAGKAFNIGGGMDQSLSLLELFSILEERLNIKLEYTQLPPRISDQKIFVADTKKVYDTIGWKPKVSAKEGVYRMLDWAKTL
jgi:CDP-paratose 2-epimerase